MDIIKIAQRYRDAGCSPIPLRRDSKIPSLKGWQKHADEPVTNFDVFRDTNGIGLVMGYDNIQCLDIDAKHFEGNEYDTFIELINDNAPGLYDKMIVQQTQSGGYHWIFKCSVIAGNEKLAKNTKGEVTFETRGMGGQIVVWPTKGYKIQGKITDVVEISPDERNVIWSCAKMMDATPPKSEPIINQPNDSVYNGDVDETTPWGEFRATYTVLDVLTQAGWTIVRENDRMVYVLRPGDTKAESSGVVFKDSGLFFPFTTSTQFEAEKPHDAFQAFVVLAHNGDFQSAIRELRNDGFGSQPEPQSLPDDALFDYESADEEQLNEMDSLLASLEVDSTIEIAEPEKAITLHFGMEQFIFGTLGNFSLIQGKAKSRKSYFLSAIMAAAISSNDVCEHIRGHLSDRVNIYIDTEQGDWHASKAKNRIQSMAGFDPRVNQPNFKHYRFRGLLTNKERLRLVDYIMQTTQNIGLMVIDGIVDLASKGVNDEEEATAIASKLLQWTSNNNCHIACVLHENKNDRNAKGHLGAYLVQKAETTVSLSKSETTPSASDIVPEYTRNIEFPSMEMTITGFDTIELVKKEELESIPDRVWTSNDMQRILPSIDGKTAANAVQFIQDTEDVPKRIASKLLNEMEANQMFEWIKKGRSNTIQTNSTI
jgi:hypothetical protein